ncbi:hypothetical protein IJU97_02620 [bacterium]|nr:hypothetical protein [bacterium]
MPEDIPAVEDIKYARKRLEDLEFHDETEHQSFDVKLAEKLMEKEFAENSNNEIQEKPQSAQYNLPDNVYLLQNLAKIINGYP